MKKCLAVLLGVIVLISAMYADESIFKYDSSKMDVGSMYSYSIKELNGKKEMMFYFYVKDTQTILSYVDFSTVIPQVFVIEATFNPEYCCFEHTYGYNPFSYVKFANSNDTSSGVYNLEKGVLDLTMTYYNASHKLKTMTGRKNLAMVPTYEVSLYQLDFWFAMRFNQGNKKFNIGTFFNGSASTSEVTYKGEEIIHGILCDKWEIAQKGVIAKLSSQKQTIWFDKSDPYYKVISYTNTANVSPVGKLDLNFESKTLMSIDEWNSFVEQKNEEARVRLGFKKK